MPRDLRRYARQTNNRLLFGGILILYIVGGGLIFWIYGKEAAILSLLCITLGLSPLFVIWLALAILDWIARRAD